MSHCERCGAPPATLPESGTLYLAPPGFHARARLRSVLVSLGLLVEEPVAGVLAVALAPGRLRELAGPLAGALTQAERHDTRSLALAAGVTPSLAELMAMQPLDALLGQAQGDWLASLIRDERLTSHFQPIVRANAPAEVFAHECLLRGVDADGALIPPVRLYGAARAGGLLFQLDRAARLRAVREAARLRVGSNLFINFNPSSVYDPAFCLRSTFAAVKAARLDPARVVFEIVESDQSGADLPRIVRHYREAGFRVALDDLGAGFGSLNLLNSLRPDFVKLDMELIRGVDRDPYKARITSKLVEMARNLGVATIAEGIETEGELSWARAHRVDFLQGFLIARPGNPPPTVRRFEAAASAVGAATLNLPLAAC